MRCKKVIRCLWRSQRKCPKVDFNLSHPINCRTEWMNEMNFSSLKSYMPVILKPRHSRSILFLYVLIIEPCLAKDLKEKINTVLFSEWKDGIWKVLLRKKKIVTLLPCIGTSQLWDVFSIWKHSLLTWTVFGQPNEDMDCAFG